MGLGGFVLVFLLLQASMISKIYYYVSQLENFKLLWFPIGSL